MPWFSLVFLAGNALPVAFSPCCGTHCCKHPNPNFPDGEKTSHFLNFQTCSPSAGACKLCSPGIHCIRSNPHATDLLDSPQLQKLSKFAYETSYMEKRRLNSWLQTKFWKGNYKQQKQLPVYLSLWDFSGAQKPRKQISSAPLLHCYLKESASLLLFCPPCDSDSHWVASWVQMKYQIISWGLQFPFLLIF